jgi:hypothetical protein
MATRAQNRRAAVRTALERASDRVTAACAALGRGDDDAARRAGEELREALKASRALVRDDRRATRIEQEARRR